MIGRRTFLLAPLAMTGCATGGPVRVAVTWSNWELARFRVVLEEFERLHPYTTDVIPLGDDIAAVLGSRRGGAVDVVLLPQVWAVGQLWNRLQSLDAFAPYDRFPIEWRSFLDHGGAVRGIPFKVAHKSVVWYRKDLFERHDLQPPATWDAWLELNKQFVDVGIAPLALGGADGWVLADFFENVLHGQDEHTYTDLKDNKKVWRSSTVVSAFADVGHMWSPPGALSGGATGALLTQAEAAVVDHFLTGRASMVAGADFTYPVIERHRGPELTGDWLGWFRFPAPDNKVHPPKVGADVVVLPAPASQGALALAEFLASKEAPKIWAEVGGLLSVHTGLKEESYPPRVKDLAVEVNRTPPGGLVFDLADQLGPVGVGLRRVLSDFLRAVGGATDSGVLAAARTAADRMQDIAGR